MNQAAENAGLKRNEFAILLIPRRIAKKSPNELLGLTPLFSWRYLANHENIRVHFVCPDPDLSWRLEASLQIVS